MQASQNSVNTLATALTTLTNTLESDRHANDSRFESVNNILSAMEHSHKISPNTITITNDIMEKIRPDLEAKLQEFSSAAKSAINSSINAGINRHLDPLRREYQSTAGKINQIPTATSSTC